MNTINYSKDFGLSFGSQFLGALLFFIPRSIWPTKPLGTGYNIGVSLGYVNTNISAPLWSEFYINFGIIGIIIMFFIYGLITSKLQKGYLETQGQLSFYQVFVPFYSFYQIFLLRGDLLSSFANLIPVVIFSFVFVNYTKLKKNVYNSKKVSSLY